MLALRAVSRELLPWCTVAHAMTLQQAPRARNHPPAARTLLGLLALGCAALLSISSAANAGSFRGLGVFPGDWPEEATPYDISDDGTVVVGAISTPGEIEAEAFRWTEATGFVRLGNLGGEYPYSAGVGVSADGSVVVGSSQSPSSAGWWEPMRWSQATGMFGLGHLEGGLSDGLATAASADGSVIVGRSSSSLAPNSYGEAFRWTAATGMVGLGVLTQTDFVYSLGWGVSADGSVVIGTAKTPSGTEAFRWTEIEGMVPLGDLPGTIHPNSVGMDVSADGAIITGYSRVTSLPQSTRAFRWTAANGMEDLGSVPNATHTYGVRISADGTVIVGRAIVESENTAILWDARHGMRTLREAMIEAGLIQQIEGWKLESAAAIAADNLTVVGSGINPAGQREAFIANLGPPTLVQIPTASPTALAIFAALLLVAGLAALKLR